MGRSKPLDIYLCLILKNVTNPLAPGIIITKEQSTYTIAE